MNGFKKWAVKRSVTTVEDNEALVYAITDMSFDVSGVLITICPENEFIPDEEDGSILGYTHQSRIEDEK